MAEQNIDKLSIEISASTQKAVKNIDSLSNSLNKLGTTLSKNINSTKLESVASAFKSLSESTRQFGKSTRAIDNLPKLTKGLSEMANTLGKASISQELLQLADSLSKMQGSGGAFKAIEKSTSNISKNVQKANVETAELKQRTEEVKDATQTAEKSTRKFALSEKTFEKLGKAGSIITKEFTRLSDRIKGLKGRFGGLSKEMKKSFKSELTNLLKYYFGIRSLFVLTNRLRSGIEDGTKNLVKYSSEYNKTISTILSGVGTVKNAMAVAFAPIVTYFSQAINALLDTLISAFNTLARLFAKFTGAKQVIQATRYYEDYAASLGSASAAAQNLTTGIDELNILNDSSGGSGSSGYADVADMFETIDVDNEFSGLAQTLKDAIASGDFTEIGTAIADKINEVLQNINWTKIRATSSKFGKALATFLNGIAEEELNGSSFGRTLGTTIGQGVNTAIDFAYSFVKNFHWVSWGQMVADGIKGALETIEWKKLGKTLSTLAIGLLDYWITIFDDDQLWTDLGKAIGEFLSEIDFKAIWFRMTRLAEAIAKAIKTALWQWAKTDPESFGIAAAIGVAITGIKVANLLAVINGTTLAKVIGKAITQSIKNSGGISLSLADMGLSFMLTDTIGNLISGKDIAGNVMPEKGESAQDYSKRNYEEKYGEGSYEEMLKSQQEFDRKYTEGWNKIKDSFKSVDLFGEIKSSYEENFAPIPDNAKTAVNNIGNNFDLMKGDLTKTWNEIKVATSTTWTTVRDDLTNKWNEIKNNASTTWANVKQTVSSKWNEIKQNTSTTWDSIKSSTASTWNTIKSNANSSFEYIRSTVASKWNSVKSDTSAKWESIKSSLSATWTSIKTTGTSAFNTFKNNVVTSFNNIKNGIKTPINAIIGFIESMVNRVADGFNQVAKDLENVLSVNWTNPVTGKHYHAGLSLPRAGHISLARLEDGGFVPNTNMGSLFWAGENGAEVVAHASGGTEVMNASQVGSAVSEGVRQAIVQAVTPYLTQIMNDTKDLAGKDFTTYIGDREIARANARGSKLNGVSLINI